MGDCGSPCKDKWVCPNDRQLALRAKLKTGWSVKSSQLQSFTKPPQLNDSEQEYIMAVIQRADNIDKREQERIGRLVEKLENMKKHAIGNGANHCILCGDDFGLLGASSLSCHDCKKAVCTKCGVDTFSAQKDPLWLCKICAETREMWKKSGAWFFKGLPKYVLPEKKQDLGKYLGHPGRQSGDPRSGKVGRLKPRKNFNTWAISGSGTTNRSSPVEGSDQETESSSDEDGMHLGKTNTFHRHKGDSVGSSDSLSTSPRVPSVALSPTCLDTRSTRSSISTKDGSIAPEVGSADYETKVEHSDSERSMTSEVLDLYTLPLSRRRRKPKLVLNKDMGEGLSPSSPVRGVVNITDHYDDDDVDRIFTTYKRRGSATKDGGDRSPLSLSNHPPARDSPVDDVFDERFSPDDSPNCGSLEFSLLYDSINNALHSTIHRAKGLQAMDSNGLSDPYVKLHLLPGASKSNKLRTKTVHKTLNPEFNETLTYYGITENDMARKTLRLLVLDEDTFGHDFIGETRVLLKQLRPHQTKHFNVYLERQHSLKKDDELLVGEHSRGKILLALRYSTQKQGLMVGIIRCSHLPSMDSNGFSDPFAKIQLKPDPQKKKYKTAIKWKNLNPEFNEEFVFDVKLQDITKRTLEIAVWDKDYGRTNDYIGGLQIGITSKGERLRHWLDMLKNPDRRHERWHHLSEDMVSD